MLLIRPRRSVVRQSRAPRGMPLEGWLHLIIAPFYAILAYLGAKYTKEYGLYVVLKEVLYWASVLLLVVMALPRFARTMNETKKPRQ